MIQSILQFASSTIAILSSLGTGYEVTHRKDCKTPMLIATDDLREKLTASKARFLAEAWKAAYKKARTLGWLAS